MAIFEIEGVEIPGLNKVLEDSINELDSFFELNWKHNRPNLVLVPDRRTIDALRGERTPDWFVGWADGTTAYLLSRENYERESSHRYSDEGYSALIKHELAHCFTNAIGNDRKPVWLLEGISTFLAGQNRFETKPEKLQRFIEFYESFGPEVYKESGFAMEFLVKEYGKERALNLLRSLKGLGSREDFARLFESKYAFELDYKNFKVL